jgi:hypothetical protein
MQAVQLELERSTHLPGASWTSAFTSVPVPVPLAVPVLPLALRPLALRCFPRLLRVSVFFKGLMVGNERRGEGSPLTGAPVTRVDAGWLTGSCERGTDPRRGVTGDWVVLFRRRRITTATATADTARIAPHAPATTTSLCQVYKEEVRTSEALALVRNCITQAVLDVVQEQPQ